MGQSSGSWEGVLCWIDVRGRGSKPLLHFHFFLSNVESSSYSFFPLPMVSESKVTMAPLPYV